MNILTWNINGIRASKVPLKQLFDSLESDVICLQETKITRDQLDEATAVIDGYSSYFSFSRGRSGYSGVATYVKDHATPNKATEGLTDWLSAESGDQNIEGYGEQVRYVDDDLQSLDSEGRTIITQHTVRDAENKDHTLTIINVYCPRADPEKIERKTFKIQFYELLQTRAEAILATGSHVIVLGDVNTSHKAIDHCDPSDDLEFKLNPGRKWLDQLLCQTEQKTSPPAGSLTEIDHERGGKFVDSFRYFHPTKEQAYTCWCSMTGARATNYGSRIDYILGNRDLVQHAFTDCIIMADVEGSDHCPVRASLNWSPVPANKCPSACTRFFPEFSGKQQKLSSFFIRKPKSELVSNENNSSQEQTNSESAASKQTFPLLQAIKRSNSSSNQSQSKKQKLEKKSSSSGKQISLMNFFGAKNKQNSNSSQEQSMDNCPNLSSSQENKSNIHEDENKGTKEIDKRLSEGEAITCKRLENQPSKVASSWKALLKGPPTAPLCRGHKEPCLLRTVKKDSLNKGRQFWVCPRPEGHKSNPEARCEHFEWIVKKK